MNSKMMELLSEISHETAKGILSGTEDAAQAALEKIHAAIASALPVDHGGASTASGDEASTARGGEASTARGGAVATGYRKPQHVLDFIAQVANVPFADMADPAFLTKIAEKFKLVPNEPRGIEKFLTVADGVKLVRFRGKDETRLVARRVGKSGNPNTIFEIHVDHKEKYAEVRRDGTLMYSIQGETIGHSFVEKLTISSLHRYFKTKKQTNEKRKRKCARKAAEKAQGGDALPTGKEVA